MRMMSLFNNMESILILESFVGAVFISSVLLGIMQQVKRVCRSYIVKNYVK